MPNNTNYVYHALYVVYSISSCILQLWPYWVIAILIIGINVIFIVHFYIITTFMLPRGQWSGYNRATTQELNNSSILQSTILHSLWCDSVTLLTATDMIMSLLTIVYLFVSLWRGQQLDLGSRPRPICILIAGVVTGEAGAHPASTSSHAPINECKLSAANWDRLQLTPSPGQHSEQTDGKYLD